MLAVAMAIKSQLWVICRILFKQFLMALAQHSSFWMLLMNVLKEKSFLTGFRLLFWQKIKILGFT